MEGRQDAAPPGNSGQPYGAAVSQLAATPRPFYFTTAMRGLCQEICRHTPEFAHIRLEDVAIGSVQARSPATAGVLASLTPLRFEGGARQTIRRGVPVVIQRVCDGRGREMLYLLSFMLPRFQDAPLEEKLRTVFHELWHIGPDFDGDLRRHTGRCFAHGSSRKRFNAQLQPLIERWRARAAEETYAFLRFDFDSLRSLVGPIYGQRYRRPRLVPVCPGTSR